jgi:hypothetical protein
MTVSPGYLFRANDTPSASGPARPPGLEAEQHLRFMRPLVVETS